MRFKQNYIVLHTREPIHLVSRGQNNKVVTICRLLVVSNKFYNHPYGSPDYTSTELPSY